MIGPDAPLQLDAMPAWLADLLGSDAALLVLLGVFLLEGAMLLYFIPSELVVPGALAAIGTRPVDVVAVLAVAVVGATAGQCLLFIAARRGGREWLLARPWFPVSGRTLDRFDAWFDRWGPVVIPISNTLLFTRGMLTVPAGLSDLRARRFLLLSALGTLCFEAILACLFLVFDAVVLA